MAGKAGIVLLVAVLLALSGCSVQPPQPQASATMLEPSASEPPTQAPATPTDLPVATETATLPPADTPLPAPTEPPAPTFTHTSPPEPAALPVDPAAQLGAPDLSDALDAHRIFAAGVTPCYRTEFSSQGMSMSAQGTPGDFCWQYASLAPVQDFYLEVLAENTDCAGGNRFGLVLRAETARRGYMFGITCDGKYRLSAWDGVRSRVLVDLTPDESLQAGQGAVNRLGARLEGDRIDLYANGTLLTSLQDGTFQGAGRLGTFVQPFSPQGFSVTFRDWKLWTLGGGAPISAPATAQSLCGVDEDEIEVMLTTDTVHVRSGPGNQYESLGKVPAGTVLLVSGYSPDGRWASACFSPYTISGGAGWVNTAYLRPK